MPIDLRRMARQAKLSIEDDKLSSFTDEMGKIVKMMEKLPSLETEEVFSGAMETIHLRPDEVRPSLPWEAFLENAPRTEEGYFLVPRTVE